MLHRSLVASSLFAATLFVANLTGASAQSMPSPKPSATPAAKPATAATPAAAPAPSATPYKLITFTGSSVDVGFTSVLGTDKARFTNGNPARVFDAGNGPFQDYNSSRFLAPANDFNTTPDLQHAIVNVNLNGPFIGGRIEYGVGSDFDAVASNGQNHNGNGPIQAYVQAVKGPITFLVGKFATLAGAEVLESAGDTNYSRSYTFGNAIPFTHTGARLTYAYNSKIAVTAGVNNGWDDTKFVGKKKTIEGSLALTPSPGYALTLTTYNGNDFAVFGDPAILSNRMLYDGVLTIHPTAKLTLNGEYDNGTQLADKTGAFSTAHYNSILGIATYQFNPLYALSLRKESFHDTNGFRSGLVQRYQSGTATIDYTPNSTYVFRGEYRLDGSDGNNFTFRNDNANVGRAHQPSLGLEAIVKFP